MPQTTEKQSPAASHRVLLIAPAPPPYGGIALQAQKLERLLREDGHRVVWIPSNLPFPNGLRVVEYIRGLRPLVRSVWMSIKLWGQVRQADVVHIMAASWTYFFLVAAPAVVLSRMRGKRVVLNYRGGEADRFFRWFGWIIKPIFKMATVVTTASEFLAEVIRTHFQISVRIVPNILDLAAFKYRQRTSLEPKMLLTRHLEKIYEVDSALKAFRKVQQRHPDASFWIAGTGSQEQYLRNLVSEWKLRNVRFLGHVAHEDLPAVCAQCDILLNASRVDNFPGALLEASAAGLVVVSTCAGGIPFIYRNGMNALLVQPGDWQALAEAVERVLHEPSLAHNLTLEAAALARKCEWKNVRSALYEAYGFVVERHQDEVMGVPCAVGDGSNEVPGSGLRIEGI